MNRTAIGAALGLILGIAAVVGIRMLLQSVHAAPGWAPYPIGFSVFMATFGLIANTRGTRRTLAATPATQRQALAMEPPAGHGLVVIYREGLVNRSTPMNFRIDDREIVQLMAPRFTAFALVPGPHRMVAAFAGVVGQQTDPVETSFTLGAGEIACFRVTTKMKLTTSLIVVERNSDIAAVKARLARVRMIMPG